MFDSAKKIKNFILIGVLILVILILCFQNYSRGSYLSGWDTLHSEFNFGISFSRMFSPAFQEHQGLGAVSAQSHIADFPRVLFLFILSIIFDESFLRYSYVFLMLIIGPLGVYLFLKDFLSTSYNHNDEEDDSMLFPSFIGALFYLTNLSVVQHFNIPLEMFLTLYGYLGFVFLAVSNVLKDPSKINLRNLIIVSILISPSSHTATLFYMFVLVLGVYLFVNLFVSEDRFTYLKNSIVALMLIIGANLFWILPNIYFVLTRGVEVSSSKIHTLFSDQAYLSNLSFGNIFDIALLKNYLFLWQIWDGQKFVSLLEAWNTHLATGIYLYGYFVFVLGILGILIAVVKREKKLYSFIIIFFLTLFFIFSSNSLVGFVFDFLRNNIPLLKEALRFPYNKFSTIFSFIISVFLSYSVWFIFSLVKRESLKIASVIFFFVFSIIYFYPAFQGNLINPLMRLNFDKSYFELFDYFNNQNEYGRIADLPVHSVYGWTYYGYNFDYQGAGFLWFGINKPLLNREFDRWNVKNEDYFNEMSSAIYNDDSDQLEKVINKYQIRWILVDKNIFAPNEDPEILHFNQIEKTLQQIPNLAFDKKIGENIYVYKYFPQFPFAKSEILNNVSYVSNESFRESQDLAYKNLGNYYSNFSDEISFGIKTPTEILNTSVVSSDKENFYIKNVKNLKSVERLANVLIQDNNLKITTLEKEITFSLPSGFDLFSIEENILRRNNEKQIKVGTSTDVTAYKLVSNFSQKDIDNFVSIGNCGVESFGSKYSLQKGSSNYVMTADNTTSCLNFDLRDLFKDQNFDNFIFEFSIINQNSNSYFCVLELGSSECNKRKLGNSGEFLLNKNQTNLIIFNEPITNLDAVSIVNNLKLTLLSKGISSKLEFNSDFIQNKEIITLKKDLQLSGNLSKFGFNPRICSTQDLVSARTGLYESSEFNICDSFNINYDPRSFHLVEITSKNNSGLPLRVCLQNSITFRCDLFISLPKNKDFKSDYLLLPPFKGPHSLAVTNQVIEGNVSSNEVSYLSIKKIDYLDLFELKKENPVDIYAYHKAFDKGFIAWCGIWVCPFEHVLVNNWANGWVIPENSSIKADSILIIYWPNYLPILGILLAFIGYFYSLKLLRKPSKSMVIDKK